MARGFLTRIWSPINRGLQAAGEMGKEVTNVVGNVFSRSVTGVRRVGRSATGRLNQGFGELVKSKSRKNRSQAGGKSKKKATRKHKRKQTKKTRTA